jgi:hypothetical protein
MAVGSAPAKRLLSSVVSDPALMAGRTDEAVNRVQPVSANSAMAMHDIRNGLNGILAEKDRKKKAK